MGELGHGRSAHVGKGKESHHGGGALQGLSPFFSEPKSEAFLAIFVALPDLPKQGKNSWVFALTVVVVNLKCPFVCAMRLGVCIAVRVLLADTVGPIEVPTPQPVSLSSALAVLVIVPVDSDNFAPVRARSLVLTLEGIPNVRVGWGLV